VGESLPCGVRLNTPQGKGEGNENKILLNEPLAKLLKARGSRHSGQAKRDPESSIFEQFWIPAPAPDPIGVRGMTE